MDCPIPGATGWSKPTGNCSLGVMILGEALGEAEAAEHRPFVEYAEAGSLLERAIRKCGFDREQFVLWNVVPVRPPNDYLEGTPYESAAIKWGEEQLRDTLANYPIRSILALGGIATRVCTGLSGKYFNISNLRGWVLPSRFGSPCIPAFHPTFIRRGALPLFADLMHCLKLAVAVANTSPRESSKFFSPVLWRDYTYTAPVTLPDPLNPQVPPGYLLNPCIHKAENWLNELQKDSTILLSYDIETPRSTGVNDNETDELGETEITSIQFSYASGTGIFLPWREPFLDIIRAALATPNPKAGANTWRFDDPLLETHGCPVRGVRHDMRWAFHHMQPDLKAALMFISSFYCPIHEGWAPWKHLHASHPEFYGIRDVDAIHYIWGS